MNYAVTVLNDFLMGVGLVLAAAAMRLAFHLGVCG